VVSSKRLSFARRERQVVNERCITTVVEKLVTSIKNRVIIILINSVLNHWHVDRIFLDRTSQEKSGFELKGEMQKKADKCS